MEDPRKSSVEESGTNSVQHVDKKSSDELLRKFADEEDEKPLPRLAKRRRKSQRAVAPGESTDFCDSPSHGNGGSLVERRSLLPATAGKRRSVLLRRLGIGRSQLRSRDIRNKSLLGAIEKTWRKTLEGATRVLLEKHYNRHKRLISDHGV